jgi:hypothetical protein
MRTNRQRDPGRRHGLAAAFVAALAAAVLLGPVPAARALTTTALLDTLQHTAFDYFWEEASAGSGLIKDGSQDWSVCSIAAQGFGYSAYCVAVDHGWVTREAARDRIIRGLEKLWTVPQGTAATNVNGYKGFFYHFLDLNTGVRTWDCELSSIDTALLIAGILDAKEYFDAPNEPETHLRALADSIYYRVDWDFMRNGGNGIRMGWKPGTGFSGFGDWVGYNEAMILYILAIGSPTHPVPAWTWYHWTLGYWWGTQYGQTYVIFPPLFGHQYSHCWIDFRHIQDTYMRNKGITYHENSRRATLAAREYCIANPGGWVGYAGDVWGLTASIDPDGYVAHGAPPGAERQRHDLADGGRRLDRRSRRRSCMPARCITCTGTSWGAWRCGASTASGTRSTRRCFWWGAGLAGHRPGPDHHDDRELPDRVGVGALRGQSRRLPRPGAGRLHAGDGRRRGGRGRRRPRARAELAEPLPGHHDRRLQPGAAGPRRAQRVRCPRQAGPQLRRRIAGQGGAPGRPRLRGSAQRCLFLLPGVRPGEGLEALRPGALRGSRRRGASREEAMQQATE